MKTILLLTSLTLIFTGCKPDQLPTEYNSVRLMQDIGISSCEEIVDDVLCSAISDCQSVYNYNEVSGETEGFQACIYRNIDETPKEEIVPGTTVTENEEEGTTTTVVVTEEETTTTIVNENEGTTTTVVSTNEGTTTTTTTEEGSTTTYTVPVNNSTEVNTEFICGNGNGKKVIVCQTPKGNPDNAHNICVSKQGWENGLNSNKALHTLGACD